MSDPTPRNASPAPTAPAAPATPVRAHWTPARQRIFLTALLDSGCVATAARAAGMSRSSAHRLRARLAGTPFDRIWGEAVRHHAARLADPFGSAAVAAQPPQRSAPAAHPARG